MPASQNYVWIRSQLVPTHKLCSTCHPDPCIPERGEWPSAPESAVNCLWALAFLCSSEQSSHGHGSRASSLGPWRLPFTREHPLLLGSTWVVSMAVWELLWVGRYWLEFGLPSLPSNIIKDFFHLALPYWIFGQWIGSSDKKVVSCPWFLCFPGVVSILVASTEAPRHLHGGLSIISHRWYPGVYP